MRKELHRVNTAHPFPKAESEIEVIARMLVEDLAEFSSEYFVELVKEHRKRDHSVPTASHLYKVHEELSRQQAPAQEYVPLDMANGAKEEQRERNRRHVKKILANLRENMTGGTPTS